MAFAMAFTMMAGAAFTDSADIEATEAVDTLTALGVINGYEDNSFKPNGTVTRAEMAAMIYIVRNGGKTDASGYENLPTSFTDIKGHWAEGFIKHAQTMGIISGRNDKAFDPNAKVTGVEAALMCLRTAGYDAAKAGIGGAAWANKTLSLANEAGLLDDVKKVTGVEAALMCLRTAGYDAAKAGIGGAAWANKTLSLANEAGLLDDVKTDLASACPRQWAAQLIFNLLDTDCVTWSNDSETFEKHDRGGKPYGTVGEKYMDLQEKEGQLLNISYNDDKDEFTYKVGEGDKEAEFTTEADYTEFFAQNVNILFKVQNKKTVVYGIYEQDSDVLVESVAHKIEDLDKITSNTDKVKIDGTEYKLEKVTGYYFGGAKIDSLTDLQKKEGWNSFNFKGIDNDDNSKIDTVVVFPVEVKQVTYVNKDGIRVGKDTYDFDDHDIYEGVKKDDWVVISEKTGASKNKAEIVKADVVSGKVQSVKDSDVRVDGTWYKKAAKPSLSTPTIKSDVDLVVYNNVYFSAEGSSTALDVAVVTGVGNYDKMNKTTEVKLMFKDGKEEIVDVEKWDDTKNNVSEYKGTKLVSYEIDDDKYTLTSVKGDTQIAKSDYKAQIANQAAYDKSRATVKLNNVEYDIDEAAFVVINNTEDDKYTCMTGAELLKRNDITFSWTTLAVDGSEVGAMFAQTKASVTSGDTLYGYIVDSYTALNADDKEKLYIDVIVDGSEVGAMFAQTKASVTSGDTLYGYIVDSYTALNADDKEKLYIDVIVDGEKMEDVETDKKAVGNFDKGTVISYTMDGDVMCIDDESAKVNTKGAIKEFNDSRVLFRDGARKLLTKDTVIIAIDSDDADNVLYAGDALMAANAKHFDGHGVADQWYNNALYKANSDDEIEVIFVEVAADAEF